MMLLTLIIWGSLQLSRLQKGGITPQLMRVATWSLVPLMLRLETAQAASFCVWNSPLLRLSISLGRSPASITAWTCWLLPAVMFDKNQAASLQIFSFYNWEKCCNIIYIVSSDFFDKWHQWLKILWGLVLMNDVTLFQRLVMNISCI